MPEDGFARSLVLSRIFPNACALQGRSMRKSLARCSGRLLCRFLIFLWLSLQTIENKLFVCPDASAAPPRQEGVGPVAGNRAGEGNRENRPGQAPACPFRFSLRTVGALAVALISFIITPCCFASCRPDYAFVINRAVFVTSDVFPQTPNPPARLTPASLIVARYML